MNVLAFFAHQDDETMLCGATLALAATQADLFLVCSTRGEGGEMGEPLQDDFASLLRASGKARENPEWVQSSHVPAAD